MTESPAIDASLAEAFEPHFKPRQLADRWGMSVTTVTALFADEPGVVKIGGRSARKRTKVTLYIPLSIRSARLRYSSDSAELTGNGITCPVVASRFA
jgi:hypothetical protein